MSGHWVGVFEMPTEHATVTITTVPDGSKLATDFAADFEQPVSLATITIDNSANPADLVVDLSQASLHFDDSSTLPVPDTYAVLKTARRERDLKSSYRCAAGQHTTDNLLLLPRGTDPRRLMSITLRINAKPRQVFGTFMADATTTQPTKSGDVRAGS